MCVCLCVHVGWHFRPSGNHPSCIKISPRQAHTFLYYITPIPVLTDVLLLQYCVFELGHKPGNEASLRMRLLQAQDDIIDRRTGSSFYHFINDLIAISLFQQSSSIFGAPLQTPEDMYSPALHTQERKPDVDDLFSAHDFDIHIDLPTGPEGMVVVFNNTSVHV